MFRQKNPPKSMFKNVLKKKNDIDSYRKYILKIIKVFKERIR